MSLYYTVHTERRGGSTAWSIRYSLGTGGRGEGGHVHLILKFSEVVKWMNELV